MSVRDVGGGGGVGGFIVWRGGFLVDRVSVVDDLSVSLLARRSFVLHEASSSFKYRSLNGGSLKELLCQPGTSSKGMTRFR